MTPPIAYSKRSAAGGARRTGGAVWGGTTWRLTIHVGRGAVVGLLVTHRMRGLGKVIHLDPQNAWVYFKDIEGTPKDPVKQLKRRVAVLTPA